MQPCTITQRIASPPSAVFDYLSDAANFPEFTDHFLDDWHMTREETYGLGAGGRFKEELPFARFGWGDMAIVEREEPRLLVLAGRSGKYNRIRTLTIFQLSDDGDNGTIIELSLETHPVYPSDKFLEALAQNRSRTRGWKKSLRRLAAILEHGEQRGERATIAGGARKPATGLRA